MTPQQEHAIKMLPLITALAEGKQLQFQCDPINPWRDCAEVSLSTLSTFPNHYRVKLEPREFWVELYNHSSGAVSSVVGGLYKERPPGAGEVIRVREIL